ncbi:ribosomal-protein-alanine N-acetyltransferase [Halorubrum aquaticum]|uniref:Ribosomal-protein-alanine N-acetyltransferase n=1 Tax=Halorubrum aquaticum TaxID=387340 RepID=A0A1I3CJ90_9EURY|nr:N-acetyltransferase [Halorubrum aquaticum]SFH74488.1 ribosomal-protein-alanine N-acetyltransferase [Halorubrum aquaticum]
MTDLEDHSDPRVRPIRPADADRVRTLQAHLREPSPDLLEYGIAVDSGFVSVADGRAADDAGGSTAGGGPVVGYALPVDAPTRSGCHLAELVVAPDFRREGRARGLLAAVVDDATGPVTLQAHPGNDAALALYETCGFDVVDRRPGAYADGDALVLRRE